MRHGPADLVRPRIWRRAPRLLIFEGSRSGSAGLAEPIRPDGPGVPSARARTDLSLRTRAGSPDSSDAGSEQGPQGAAGPRSRWRGRRARGEEEQERAAGKLAAAQEILVAEVAALQSEEDNRRPTRQERRGWQQPGRSAGQRGQGPAGPLGHFPTLAHPSPSSRCRLPAGLVQGGGVLGQRGGLHVVVGPRPGPARVCTR